jgi:hypothetical protein
MRPRTKNNLAHTETYTNKGVESFVVGGSKCVFLREEVYESGAGTPRLGRLSWGFPSRLLSFTFVRLGIVTLTCNDKLRFWAPNVRLRCTIPSLICAHTTFLNKGNNPSYRRLHQQMLRMPRNGLNSIRVSESVTSRLRSCHFKCMDQIICIFPIHYLSF